MKRCIAVLVAFGMLWQGCFAQMQKSGTKTENKNVAELNVALPTMHMGSVVLEAEDGTLTADATVVRDAAASGTAAVRMVNAVRLDSPSTANPPTLKLGFIAENDGTYKVWVRLKSPSSGSDSMYAGYGNGGYTIQNLIEQSGYYWFQMADLTGLAGENYINIMHREAGVEVDKVIVTADTEFAPKNINDMPAEVDTSGNSLYPLPTLTPPESHPRVLLNEEVIAEIKENVKSDLLKVPYEKVKSYAEGTLDCKLPDDGKTGNHNGDLITKLQSRALLYALGEVDEAHGRQTVQYMRDYLETVIYRGGQDITRSMGDTITTGAMVYDWCYDLMSEEDKTVFIRRFKEICAEKEIGWPPTAMWEVGGHSGEGEIMRDLLCAGIACYDEDPQIYNLAAGRFLSNMVESRRLFNQSGTHPNGGLYGGYRLAWEYRADVIFERMGYHNVLGEGIGDVPLTWIYDRLPTGEMLKDGDMPDWGRNMNFKYSRENYWTYLLGGNLYDNPYVQGEFIKENALNNYSSSVVMQILYASPDKEWKYPDDLPLAYATTYPLTSLTARTSWQNGLNAPTAMVKMTAHERNIDDHMHKDVGSFQIYYKGSLALDSGNYAIGYGTAHDYNYNKRTIAHNLVTVYDPNESTWFGSRYTVNDGGQIGRQATVVQTYEDMMSDENLRAETKGVYIGPNDYTPEFSYLKTDISKAYTDKVSEYQRSMVFMDLFEEDYPAAFVVFDRVVSSDASFKKKWLLHSINEPVVEDNTTTIARTEDGLNGKLVNKTMLPQDFTIDKVGGEGYEFYVDGQNYPWTDPEGIDSESGAWRIELSPAKDNTEDLFLNAMYVTDYDKNLPELPMYQENADSHVGVTVKDRYVLFSKTGEPRTSSLTVNVRDNGYGTVSCMIADMVPGVWKVSGNGMEIFAEVKEDENVLYFKGAPGQYTLSPADGATPTEFTYPQAEKEKYGDFLVNEDELFLYQKYPTRLVDGIPYLAAETFEEIGAKVAYNGDSVTVTGIDGTAVFTAGTATYLEDGTEKTASGTVWKDGNAIYIPADSVEKIMWCTMQYDEIAKILTVRSNKLRKEFMDTYHATPIMPVEITSSGDDGNKATNLSDWSLATRWSAEGDGQWAMYDMGEEVTFSKVMLAFHQGAVRTAYFDIQVSHDGRNWRTVYENGESQGTKELETYEIGETTARYIRYLGHRNSLNGWNSPSEFIIVE